MYYRFRSYKHGRCILTNANHTHNQSWLNRELNYIQITVYAHHVFLISIVILTIYFFSCAR